MVPILIAWIKEWNYLSAVGGEGGEVRPLVQIAVRARKAKIRLSIVLDVLPSIDVFDVERQKWKCSL